MTILEKLQRIQLELKAPKNQRNAFGKYNYRSAEDILEAVKPFEGKYKVIIKITDELKQVGEYIYVDSEAKMIDVESLDRESSVCSNAQAIIDFSAKGMQMPQRTGAASSYAKKYAISNLLLLDDTKDSDATLDDTKDSDATNTHNSKSSLPTLKAGSPEFNKVYEFMTKGGEISKVKLKYVVTKEVEQLLNK